MLPNLIFRRTQPHDEPVLREMLYHAVFVPPGVASPDRAIVEQPAIGRYVNDWGRRGDDGIVAVAADAGPIGAAWMRVWSEHDHGYGFIDTSTPELSIAVRPGFRARGIGAELLRRLLERADESYPRVSLSVSLLNPAVRLYERLGFARVSADEATMIMARNRPSERSDTAVSPA